MYQVYTIEATNLTLLRDTTNSTLKDIQDDGHTIIDVKYNTLTHCRSDATYYSVMITYMKD